MPLNFWDTLEAVRHKKNLYVLTQSNKKKHKKWLNNDPPKFGLQGKTIRNIKNNKNQRENKNKNKVIQRVNKAKSWLFQKTNMINRLLAQLTEREAQINKTRNYQENYSGHQTWLRDYLKIKYSIMLENLKEMVHFLDSAKKLIT